MTTDNKKLDLRNGHIGGRPKDWLERANEPSLLTWRDHMLWISIVVLAVAAVWLLLPVLIRILSR